MLSGESPGEARVGLPNRPLANAFKVRAVKVVEEPVRNKRGKARLPASLKDKSRQSRSASFYLKAEDPQVPPALKLEAVFAKPFTLALIPLSMLQRAHCGLNLSPQKFSECRLR